jgi:hypothetical protein
MQPGRGAWVARVNDVANYILFPLVNSWYMGANIAGESRVFTPYISCVSAYRQTCGQVVARGPVRLPPWASPAAGRIRRGGIK